MTDDEIKALVLRELGNIAPEIDPAQIDPAVNVRDQIDLDSMNVLDLMIAIHEATGVEIPGSRLSQNQHPERFRRLPGAPHQGRLRL